MVMIMVEKVEMLMEMDLLLHFGMLVEGLVTQEEMEIMEEAIRMVAVTMMGPRVLGIRCLRRIYQVPLPMVWAADTYSCFFRLSISPRTTRAMSTQ